MHEYRVPLDPRKPGQFLACCGMFELADISAPGGIAAFERAGQLFALNTDATFPPKELKLLPAAEFENKTLEPLTLACTGGELALNWWLNETLTGKSAFKTWGGQQTPRRVLEELLGELKGTIAVEEMFAWTRYMKSRFGGDARAAWEALDAGYSPNDIGQDAATFPWVEILAVIGLQGFRPAQQKRARYRYSAWSDPLPIAAARAACAAPWPGLSAQTFEFEVAVRGQGYKTFLFAEGVNHA